MPSWRFSVYATVDYLTSTQDAAAYIEAAIEYVGDDPAFITLAQGVVAHVGNLS